MYLQLDIFKLQELASKRCLIVSVFKIHLKMSVIYVYVVCDRLLLGEQGEKNVHERLDQGMFAEVDVAVTEGVLICQKHY